MLSNILLEMKRKIYKEFLMKIFNSLIYCKRTFRKEKKLIMFLCQGVFCIDNGRKEKLLYCL